MNEYYKEALEMNDELVTNRRMFHNYAETGFDLPQTISLVIKKLTEYGLKPYLVGKSGVSCTLGQSGKTILLRADMDALPMSEKTGLNFAATNGNCHSCGHDCHTTMLLGAAKLLKEHENELKGTVKFMFQPAEELLAGANDMLSAGILENPKVDAAMGIHIKVGYENSNVGSITYAKGTAFYSGDAVRITITGKNAHGSTPEKGVDAINIAAHMVISLQEIIAREIPCTEHSVLIVGKIQGGDTVNTLAGNAVIEASIRATTQESRSFLKKRIREISENVAATFRGDAIVEFLYGIGPLYNNPILSEEIANYCKEICTEEKVKEIPTACGTEDFTSIAEQVPSIMINLGAGSIEGGYSYSIHNPSMIVDEKVLPLGSALYAHCATKYLENNL
ncbi:M20 metallopeptidase family protein [Clostridium scatologenes]|uniref:Amidohydrolase n=1 Tax=Clostridium scatologenes TaxID=1548 RepID=A0A0E3GQA9_CLOSL|nr:M20 family metallopeptidase [Clostridium scatologenes]AKA68251.1 amidohydrolase [Clostridium scatologenes]